MVSRVARGSLLTLLVVAVTPDRLPAQDSKVRFDVRAGVVAYGTGSEERCNPSRSPSIGIEARSRGPWILSATGDLQLVGNELCIDVLPVAEFEGRQVGVWGENFFLMDPRFAIHAGYEISVPIFGGVDVGPTIGAGLQYTEMGFGERAGGDSSDWRPWYGGTLSIRPAALSGFGLQVEAGRHQLLRRYCPPLIGDCQYNGGILHEFTIWRDFYRFGLTYTIN